MTQKPKATEQTTPNGHADVRSGGRSGYRHECNKNTNGVGWAHCSACGKRIHMLGCTAKRRKGIDCLCIITAEYLDAIGIGKEEAARVLAEHEGEAAN